MSISRTVNITCPSCGASQNVRLYDAVNVETDPQLKDALMHNQLNRVECCDCALSFRVDLPVLYNDPKHQLLIHWIPENPQTPRESVLEEFDRLIERMNAMVPQDIEVPSVRLVLSRVELVELIYLVEAGMNQRVVEYVKYSIYTRNMDKVNPRKYQLLLNVQDSTDDELCFVMQDVESLELGSILRYGRAAYQSMCELYNENQEEFLEMFPGPYISARNLLLEEGPED